jgi:NTE family protein
VQQTSDKKRVAIACQGGGSHTAFTAGVLKGLLRSEPLQEHEVVALSGTSGGAVCALLAWHNLLKGDATGAVEDLDAFWRDNSATASYHQVVNNWIFWASNLRTSSRRRRLAPTTTPSRRWDSKSSRRCSSDGSTSIRWLSSRRIPTPCCSSGPSTCSRAGSKHSTAGTTGSCQDHSRLGGHLDAFQVRAPRRGHLLGRPLLAEPPVKELTDERPDEIWVIQINPRETEHKPKTVAEIADRRNELSGNLSLCQELAFIEKIDQMLEERHLPPGGKCKQIVVRVIELSRSRLSRSARPPS